MKSYPVVAAGAFDRPYGMARSAESAIRIARRHLPVLPCERRTATLVTHRLDGVTRWVVGVAAAEHGIGIEEAR